MANEKNPYLFEFEGKRIEVKVETKTNGQKKYHICLCTGKGEKAVRFDKGDEVGFACCPDPPCP